MFVKSIKMAQKAIFPIFRIEPVIPTGANVGVAGTGFFINDSGYFSTVAHVFDGKTDSTKFLFAGFLPDNVRNPRLEIEEVSRNDEFDLLIGKVKNLEKNDFVKLANTMPDIGRSICISGYPLATIMPNNQGGLEVGGVRRYFQPTFVLDKIRVKSNNGVGKIRQHDGFLIRDVGLFGMSGGPVFDVDGIVVGIQGSITDPRVSQNAAGRTIAVENAVAIKSELVIDLANKSKVKLG